MKHETQSIYDLLFYCLYPPLLIVVFLCFCIRIHHFWHAFTTSQRGREQKRKEIMTCIYTNWVIVICNMISGWNFHRWPGVRCSCWPPVGGGQWWPVSLVSWSVSCGTSAHTWHVTASWPVQWQCDGRAQGRGPPPHLRPVPLPLLRRHQAAGHCQVGTEAHIAAAGPKYLK